MKQIIVMICATLLLQICCLSTSAQTASITCPANRTVSTDAGSRTAIVTGIDPVLSPTNALLNYATTSADGTTTGVGSASGLAFIVGLNTVKYYLPDFPGVSCEFTITVEDHEPPVIICPSNVTVTCPFDVPAPVGATATDNVTQISSITIQWVGDVKSNETCVNRYTITRTFRATDVAGNSSTCSQIITVNDDKAPYFLQPPPMSPLNVSCPFNVPTVYPDSYTALDDCGVGGEEEVAVDFKQVRTDGPCENKYTLTRTWTAHDLCGNQKVYTQVINVNDTVAPTFDQPAPPEKTDVSCASEIPAAMVRTATDNCGDAIATVTFKETKSEEQCANKFKLTRTWTATDACGNTATVSQVFVVNDNIPPVFDGSDPYVINVSCTKDIPVAPRQTVTDNCGGTATITYTETKTNVQCENRYTLTRKWIATDACGNTAARTQTINVADFEAPKVSAVSANAVVLWPPNHKMRDVTIDYTASDNCGYTATLSVTSSDPVSGGSDGDQSPDWEIIDEHHVRLRAEKANNGQARHYTVTVTVTDGCNAAVSSSVEVIVAHNITGPQTGNPFKVGSTVSLNGVFWDKPGNTHTAKWLLDGSTATNGDVAEPSGNQNGKVSGNYKFNTPGVYKLQMNIIDQNGITSYANTNNDLDAIVVIYDPNGGNAYGGGWFESQPGALTADRTAEGKASYGFSVNYGNAAKPKGETQFEFKVGSFEFNALNFDYLSINNGKAQFRGTGKIIGGQSGIGFMMTIKDGEIDGSGADKIRMKIYNRNTGYVYYDNQPGASDADDPATVVGTNSSIVIQAAGTYNTTAARPIDELHDQSEGSDKLDVIAGPNPTEKSFSIQIKNNDFKSAVHITVFGQNGKLMETKMALATGSTIQLGETYPPGAYFLRIVQGNKHAELKLIKL